MDIVYYSNMQLVGSKTGFNYESMYALVFPIIMHLNLNLYYYCHNLTLNEC